MRESFEAFQRASLAAAAGDGPPSAGIIDGESGERQSVALDSGNGEGRDELAKMERMATLDVLGMSALTGYVDIYCIPSLFADKRMLIARFFVASRDGVKNAVEWLYSRVQNARKM